jgi:type I restriction enzyme S subunit
MIAELKPYPEYKETGLPWLGQIPAKWTTARTKTQFRLSIEKSGKSHGKELLSVYTHIGVRPRKDLKQRGNKASSTDGYWVVNKGDIIVNKLLAWMGAVGVSHYDGVTSPAYDILRPIQQLNSDYYHQLFRTPLYLKLFKARSRGIMDMRLRLYFDQLGQIPLICPPPTEQGAIVRFLNWSNGQLNRATKAKLDVIKLLNEQKQAIIYQAVTKGLDPNVKMKNSGIQWLGEIPEHWEVRKVRTCVELIVSNVDKHFRMNEKPVRLCNYTDVYKNECITNSLNFMRATATRDEIAKFRIRIDDVIVTKDSEEWDDIGVPSYVAHEDPDLLCGYHLAILRPRKELVLGEFLQRTLQDRFVATQMHISAKGVTRYGLSHQGIKDVLIPLPPQEEQKSICIALTIDLERFATAISRLEREIFLLREYRSRLVADVVTGKLDVREAATKLPEETIPDIVEDVDDLAEEVVSSDEETTV